MVKKIILIIINMDNNNEEYMEYGITSPFGISVHSIWKRSSVLSIILNIND